MGRLIFGIAVLQFFLMLTGEWLPKLISTNNLSIGWIIISVGLLVLIFFIFLRRFFKEEIKKWQ